MAEFDRVNPLFERDRVPFEIITSPSTGGVSEATKNNGNFTVRILQGHRPQRDGGNRERVIRFEMSDECNLVDESSEGIWARNGAGTGATLTGQATPGQGSQSTLHHQTPNVPIIHAPFMTADRGRRDGHSMMQSNSHPHTGNGSSGFSLHRSTQKSIPNRPIELYELEVG
eukprot:CAMPEP_0183776454 /NCGR_PEP_ID=MMETSP0739-20130205/46882_1 /TAXON_ID=385413 /ORGANISM="Thalassiosira miniscula, Strain CCMP1093" /LENGTH=170 /DNA_ID=CAMNT_0026018325 /DNA_START=38 /DNA_END=546 /DNA_ORIENTATION=+